MSIRDVISARVQEGRLFHLPPLIASQQTVRNLFVGTELHSVVSPPWSQSTEGFRLSQLRANLDAYTEGQTISMADDPFTKPKSTFMARTAPVVHEVWDIRSRDPKPGIRVLGCFAETDTFVALVWDYREALGGPNSKEWRDLIERCKAEWRNLFITYPPHQGSNINDYVSANVLPV